VIRRWTLVFSAPLLVTRWQDGLCSTAERKIVEVLIDTEQGMGRPLVQRRASRART
jgi:hypothetical protein